ncbi:Disks Large-like 4 [Manis pentadactyla]|nr:Disks Large-like 4 [Manis pentadactyla]
MLASRPAILKPQARRFPVGTSSSFFGSGYPSRSEGSQPRRWQPTVDTELVVNCGVLPQNHLTTTSWILAQKSDKLPGQATCRRQQEQAAFYPGQQLFLDSKWSR